MVSGGWPSPIFEIDVINFDGGVQGSGSLPVVGEVDYSLLALIPNEFHLVLGRQDGLGVTLLAGGVPHAHLDSTGVPLLPISAEVLEQQGVVAMALNGVWTVKDALTPTLLTTMQGIGAVVLRQLDLLAIQILNQAILDAVCNAADGGTIVRGVVLDIILLRGETQNDVLATDTELLDDGAQRQEGECSLFGGHDGFIVLLFYFFSPREWMGKTLGEVEREYVHFHLRDMTLQPRNLRDESPTMTPCNQFLWVLFSINVDIQGVKKYIALRGGTLQG